VARDFPTVLDARNNAMTLSNHHDWVKQPAQTLTLGGDILWQAMCSAWVEHCVNPDEANATAQAVADTLHGIAASPTATTPPDSRPLQPPVTSATAPASQAQTIEPETLFEL
jgi:hypothetical protein